MDKKNRLIELLPHYLALLILIFLVLAIVRAAVGDLGFWIELAIVIAVGLGYPTLVRVLGIAPSAWERPDEQ